MSVSASEVVSSDDVPAAERTHFHTFDVSIVIEGTDKYIAKVRAAVERAIRSVEGAELDMSFEGLTLGWHPHIRHAGQVHDPRTCEVCNA